MPPPTSASLHSFLLGTLPTEEAARIAAWVADDPGAAQALRDTLADDALTGILTSTAQIQQPHPPAVENVIRTVTHALGINPPEVVPPPERIGGYRVVRELGRGGMGVVYEAVDDQLHRRVAIKRMSAALAANESGRQRFLREGRACAALKSDHVVTIYQVGEDAGTPFLAMEYLEGATLEEWLRGRPGSATTDQVLWVARDVLTGLAAAHAKGLVHRDIKPTNLWVEQDTGRVKLLDFGLTRGPLEGEPITSEGALVGTPAYMAPEQAAGTPPDARADLFSVGVVLYRMLAGRSPFQRESVYATLSALATETPESVQGVPEALSNWIAQLMAKTPAARPPEAKTALAELHELEQLPKAEPATEPARSPRRPRRKWLVAAGFLGALAASAFAAQWIIIRDKDGNPTAKVKLNPGDKPLIVEAAGKELPLVPTPDVQKKDKSPVPLSPSANPFDRLDPAKIPAEERFPWQPKELVAVIGSHARRVWGHHPEIGISPGGKYVAVTPGSDGHAPSVIWDIASRQIKWQIPSYESNNYWCSPRFASESRLVTGRHWNGNYIQPNDFIEDKVVFHGWLEGGDTVEVLESGKTLAATENYGNPLFLDVSESKPRPVGTRLPTRGRVLFATITSLMVYITPAGEVRKASIRNAKLQDDERLKITLAEGDTPTTISANGRLLAVLAKNQIHVWDIAQNPPQIRQRLTDKDITDVALNFTSQFHLSPNGRWLAAVGTNGKGQVIRIDNMRPQLMGNFELTSGIYTPSAVAFIPDERQLIVADSAGLVRFWDLSEGAPKELSPFDPSSAFTADETNLEDNNGRLLLRRTDRSLQLWDLTKDMPHPVEELGNRLSLLGLEGFSQPGPGNGWLVVQASTENPFRLVNFQDGYWKKIKEPFGETFRAARLSADRQNLFVLPSRPKNDLLVCWNSGANPPIQRWTITIPSSEDKKRNPDPICISPDGKLLALPIYHDPGAGGKSFLQLWRIVDPKPELVGTLPFPANFPRHCLMFAPDNRHLCYLKEDLTVAVIDLTGPIPREIGPLITGATDGIFSLSFGPYGRVAWSTKNGVGISDIKGIGDLIPRKPLWTWLTSPGTVRAVRYTPDGRYLLTGNANNTIYVLRLPPLAVGP
ncbi:WD40 repeat domain-containing serine/threonine protein kinase [Fimbriiglobus ruber]|uniref:Serine/threonine protein kinase PrkC, regulator of stationary phase n=1 Tax=Fimbriiglobus ruber TaxID=1908690 RepID=A0A225D9S7_9BACT|nr:WD40 repeat domain-containing serine/threonine protein kinase [Fimbriiglobus ruber]OWK36414.1 Serine/threonine protein kinase PrkC, regulator of stationary phase [Fimbriiglobus ruber]